MDDTYWREKFDDLEQRLANNLAEIVRVKEMLIHMRVADAEARGDLKAALAELRTAAVAMRDTALSFQQTELRVSEASNNTKKLSDVDIWLIRIVIALIALLGITLGGKEVVQEVLPKMVGL